MAVANNDVKTQSRVTLPCIHTHLARKSHPVVEEVRSRRGEEGSRRPASNDWRSDGWPEGSTRRGDRDAARTRRECRARVNRGGCAQCFQRPRRRDRDDTRDRLANESRCSEMSPHGSVRADSPARPGPAAVSDSPTNSRRAHSKARRWTSRERRVAGARPSSTRS